MALAVIPARWGSTRLPGKPLAMLLGKPLIQHTYEAARRARSLGRVVVATDDERIRDAVERFGGEVVMTGPCDTGTDRVCEVAAAWRWGGGGGVGGGGGSSSSSSSSSSDDASHIVVNVQGDEPLLNPAHVDAAVAALRAPGGAAAVMSTVATPIRSAAQLADPNVVKCVVDARGMALYFSRAAVPWFGERVPGEGGGADGGGGGFLPEQHPALRHVGLYAFRRSFLLDFPHLPHSALERLEKLEQLRVLEAGHRIQVVTVDGPCEPGVDTEEQLAALRVRMQHESEHDDRSRRSS